MIESLESRIAPASVVFMDQDGDKVTFTTSKGDFFGAVNANFTAPDPYTVFNLFLVTSQYDGTNLTVSVAKGKTATARPSSATSTAGPTTSAPSRSPAIAATSTRAAGA